MCTKCKDEGWYYCVFREKIVSCNCKEGIDDGKENSSLHRVVY